MTFLNTGPPECRDAGAEYLVAVAEPRLVFLYGPPAVGKLTVARAVAQREPFRILHNHLTIDPVTEVLSFGSEAFWRVVRQFRRDLVAAAADEHIDLISTYVFASGDEEDVAGIIITPLAADELTGARGGATGACDVDSVFPLSEARAAFERVAGRGKRGKVVLELGTD